MPGRRFTTLVRAALVTPAVTRYATTNWSGSGTPHPEPKCQQKCRTSMDNIRCPVFLCAFAVDRLSRQRKSYVHSSGRRLRVLTAACRDHHKLASIHFICNRRCVAREGQGCLPQQFARGLVESAEFLVEIGCPNKYQAACGHDRPPV